MIVNDSNGQETCLMAMLMLVLERQIILPKTMEYVMKMFM